MKDATYRKFVERWKEVTDLPPQTLGPLTGVYKTVTRKLKVMPWPAFFLTGAVVSAALYWAFGASVSRIVSLLQQGF